MNPSSDRQNPVIVIMAKVPRSGLVKTRLRPVLSDSQCVELAVCFLRDAAEKAEKITENVIIAFTPADGEKELESFLPKRSNLIEQAGKDLGERMQSAISFAENKGYHPIIIIGTDSPTVPLQYVKNAFEVFENERTKSVLGAANDGGYYLIGLRRTADKIFDNVEWSSEKAFAQTAENARRIFGCEPVQIPSWYDVDTPQDLKILYREFLDNEEFKTVAPNTAKWIVINKNILDSIS